MNAAHPGEAQRPGRDRMDELRRMADRICVLILSSDLPEVDIAIERARLRERCEEFFPDRMELYDMIYESRFERLWQQFREAEAGAESQGE